MLFKFLYHNLKGYRFLVVLAILITITQVGSDILTAFPLKFIPSKINNPGNDPACSYPFLNPILDRFDIPLFDPSLKALPPAPENTVLVPPVTQCPTSSTDASAASTPAQTHHSVNGVIIFSVLMLIIFGMLSAGLAFVDLYLAANIAQNLTARLR